MIATCADSYITDIFFSCKRVINEWTHKRHNCELSRTHQYTRRQKVNKKITSSTNIVHGLLWSIVACISSLPLHKQLLKCSKIIVPSSDWVRQYSRHFYGPLSMSAIISYCRIQRNLRKQQSDWWSRSRFDVSLFNRIFFSLGNAINKPRRLSRDKVRVNGRSIL